MSKVLLQLSGLLMIVSPVFADPYPEGGHHYGSNYQYSGAPSATATPVDPPPAPQINPAVQQYLVEMDAANACAVSALAIKKMNIAAPATAFDTAACVKAIQMQYSTACKDAGPDCNRPANVGIVVWLDGVGAPGVGRIGLSLVEQIDRASNKRRTLVTIINQVSAPIVLDPPISTN